MTIFRAFLVGDYKAFSAVFDGWDGVDVGSEGVRASSAVVNGWAGVDVGLGKREALSGVING